ncbi:MAG: N-acetylmuramoyl-L-alanine amidase [Agathobaculum sp.]|uniref:N-acetylmuramoyl-L-alanine amidase n=1 Tax=Agathobaculum sp. TaxID=2048138 RepID=UPI0025B7CC15|nr:N-acetylmuramoyl-L-alanine amidase [Agathobaculum sp.]MCI7126189.1 N-acetylmuramoyl-L-alanine amidase [Agathobaculum sp.]
MMKILLIAGHGGTPYDPGAVANGYTEAVETRRLMFAVAPLLRAYGFAVDIYDQHKDAYKVVRQGGSLPLDGVDYALEFHLNAAAKDYTGDGRTTGTEIWIHTSEKSDGVEQAILRRMAALGFRNRGVKRSGGFAVQRHCTGRGVSHALIETCFVDDKDDMTLYKARFNDIARAIADGVAEGFGKAVVEKEENEVVQKKNVRIDGKAYECACIVKNDENYVRLRDFTQAGYGISYDAKTGMPGVFAPQTRTDVPAASDEVQAAVDKLQTVCGLEEQTIAYLLRYQYGDALLKKLAAAVVK